MRLIHLEIRRWSACHVGSTLRWLAYARKVEAAQMCAPGHVMNALARRLCLRYMSNRWLAGEPGLFDSHHDD